MSDLLQRIQIIVGGNADEAKRVLNEVTAEVDKMGTGAGKVAGRAGTEAGEQFGMGMSRSTDKWLRVVEGILGRFGAPGRFAADMLRQFGRVDRALVATGREAARVGGRAAERVGGRLAGEAASTAVGTGLGQGIATGVSAGGVMHAISHPGAFLKWKKFVISNAIATKEILKEAKKIIVSGATVDDDYIQQMREGVWKNMRAGKYGNMPRWAATQGGALSGVGSLFKGTIGKAIPSFAAMSGATSIKGVIGAGGGALAVGGLAGGGLAGGGLAGLGAVAVAAGRREKQIEVEKQVFAAKALIKEINNIQDPVERAKKIIAEFGDDASQKMQDLTTKVKEYDKSLNTNSQELRVYGERSRLVWGIITGAVKGALKSVWEYNAGGIAKVSNFFAKLTGQDVTKEMLDAVNEGAANAERIYKRLDEMRKEVVAKAIKDAELQKQIDAEKIKMREKGMSLEDLIIDKEKQIIELGKKEKDDKQATLDILKLQEEIEDARLKIAKAEYDRIDDIVEGQDKYTEALEKSTIEHATQAEQMDLLIKKQKDLNEGIKWAGAVTKAYGDYLLQSLNVSNELNKLWREMAKSAIEAADKKKLSLGDLSKMQPVNPRQARNVKEAQYIQQLEEKAKNQVASGLPKEADKTFAEVQFRRQRLGQMGLLKSDEFTIKPMTVPKPVQARIDQLNADKNKQPFRFFHPEEPKEMPWQDSSSPGQNLPSGPESITSYGPIDPADLEANRALFGRGFKTGPQLKKVTTTEPKPVDSRRRMENVYTAEESNRKITLAQLAQQYPQMRGALRDQARMEELANQYPGNIKYKEAVQTGRKQIKSGMEAMQTQDPLRLMAEEFVRQGMVLPVKPQNGK